MKALVFTKKNKIEVKEVDKPKLSPDEVLIKPKTCGICGSDYDLLRGEYILPIHFPIIPGHEYAGIVAEVGAQVKDYKIGDRVVGECAVGCGSCELCKSGKVNCCPTGDHFGFTLNGAMAEYTKAKASWLHKLPDNLSFKEGALIEPFTVGYYSITNIGCVDGSDTVLILGGGVIGLSVLITAKGMGARTILVDKMENRLELAKKLNCDEVINASKKGYIKKINEFTDEKGADVVVEAVGAGTIMKELFNVAAYTGRISITGINFTKNLPVDLYKIQAKGLTVKGNIGSPFVWEKALRFLSQTKPNLSLLCTHEYSLDDAEKAFELADKSDQCVKIQFTLP